MKKRPSMQQIATALHTTPMTVSRALNDRQGVSEELKQKIKRYACEVGYSTGHTIPRNTSNSQTNIALLVAEVFIKTNNGFYIEFYKKILDSLHDNKALGILQILNEKEVDSLDVPNLLHGYTIDGIIVLGELPPAYINQLETLNIPMILLDFYDQNLMLDAVVNDNYFESYEITHHLIDHGHKEIAFIGNIYSTYSIQDRYLGYYKALLCAKIPLKEEYIISDRNKMGEFIDLALPTPLPTAFVCNCDEIAYALVQRLQAQGVHIPGDCSIVSFDNSKFSTFCKPQLTTIAPNLNEMAKSCVSNILQKITNPSAKIGIVSVKGNLIERGSVTRCLSSIKKAALVVNHTDS